MITPEEAKVLQKLRDDIYENAMTALRLGNEKKELMAKYNRERDAEGISVDPKCVDRHIMFLNVAYQSYYAESTAYQKCAEALDEYMEKYVIPF